MNSVMLARGIVVVAFVVFTHLIYSVITLPLRPALTPMFESMDAWALTLDRAFSVVALLIALRVAYGICRRLWPERTFQELVKAREAAEAKCRTQPDPPAI